MRLEAPFRAAGEHIAADLPGAHVLFTTRRGGVSTGPYASLNLGLFTEDDPAHVSENRDRVAAAVGVPRRRFQQGFQVHAAHVRALDAPPDPDEEPVPAPGVEPENRGGGPPAETVGQEPLTPRGESHILDDVGSQPQHPWPPGIGATLYGGGVTPTIRRRPFASPRPDASGTRSPRAAAR